MSAKFHLRQIIPTALTGLLFAILATFAPLSTPAYADKKPETTVETTEEKEEEGSEANSTEKEKPAEKTSGDNCTNQTGAVGWLICPTTGLIATATDALYSIIENFLVIDPVSFNNDSPVYSIWDYCRGITNIIFIIFILVIVFSQVTGLGFSNYNIKRTLPRIVIAAILINLSFILCELAVDLSNVIGSSLNSFLNGIIESTIASTGYDASVYELGNIATAIIAGGTIGGISIGVIATGGVAAFFWMLVPILLGAIVSVVTGLLTISARQAVIILLVMLAPLAIVANTLPNTEKWFAKWKNIFFQMLVFYPTFSFLFGASRLLGLVFITSATNVYGVILGVAVQIFPLFFSWQLMKMSGTLLGALNAKLAGLGARGVAASRPWARSHQDVAKAKHNATSTVPSARLHRYLENRQARRNADFAAYQEAARIRGDRFSANVYDKNGHLTRRGESLYGLTGENLVNTAETKRLRAELGEAGYRNDGTDLRIRSGAQQNRIRRINKTLSTGVDLNHAADSFVESAKTANAISYAERIEKIRKDVIRINNDVKLTEAQKAAQIAGLDPSIRSTLSSINDANARKQYMNNIFANAISAQARADKAIHDNYAQLYASTKFTDDFDAEFNKSFSEKNYNAMEAAIDELAKRGDFNYIERALMKHSGEIVGDLEMQKHLADTLIKYKADSAPLWAYAKSTNIRRAKHNRTPDKIALFATYDEFVRGVAPANFTGNESEEDTAKLSMLTILGDINNPAIAVSQDRTTFEYILQEQQKGQLSASQLGFKIKQLRSAASSGQMDGEQLANLNKLLTGGIKLDDQGNLAYDPNSEKESEVQAYHFIMNNQERIGDNIIDYLENMAAGQLASMKESTFEALNKALIFLKKDGQDYGTGKIISKTFYDAIYTNAANNMNNILKSNMNTNIKNWLGIKNNRQ